MIATGRPPARIASARSIARSVLPVAVAPAMTMSGGAAVARRPSSQRAAQGVRAGVRDPNGDLAPDQRRRHRSGGRACCHGPAGQARPGAGRVAALIVVVVRPRRR